MSRIPYDCNYSVFDVEKHKQTYTNYCEVVIHPSGYIAYAHPSHQGYLEKLGAKQRNLTISEFRDTCPRSRYCDYLNWLLEQTNTILCWSGFYVLPNHVTEAQIDSLNMLISEGLVKDVVRNP